MKTPIEDMTPPKKKDYTTMRKPSPLKAENVKNWTQQEVLTVATSDLTQPLNRHNVQGVITYHLTPNVIEALTVNPTSNSTLIQSIINMTGEALHPETVTAILNHHAITEDIARELLNTRQLTNEQLFTLAVIAVEKEWAETKHTLVFGSSKGTLTRDGLHASEINGFMRTRTYIVLHALWECGYTMEETSSLSSVSLHDLYTLITKHSLTQEHFDALPLRGLPIEVIEALVG